MSNYKIAIPSYKRVKTLQNKTLNLLNKNNINSKKIYIFVADENEKKIYSENLGKKYKIIVGKKGIKNIRNFMANFFPENEKIFYIDDDISYIYQVYNNIDINNRKYNKLEEYNNLNEFIIHAFKLCQKKKINNWGIYPIENPYFLKLNINKNHISYKLNYIMGGFTGVINKKKCELRTVNDKEDTSRIQVCQQRNPCSLVHGPRNEERFLVSKGRCAWKEAELTWCIPRNPSVTTP